MRENEQLKLNYVIYSKLGCAIDAHLKLGHEGRSESRAKQHDRVVKTGAMSDTNEMIKFMVNIAEKKKRKKEDASYTQYLSFEATVSSETSFFGQNTWNFEHRYSEFVQLYEVLCSECVLRLAL